ncbi:DNA binding methylated-DNA--cysteine S-methyltransferase [Aaosphaeria arxii CBS 175.79]|uniref:DNA binding methylated-DNA--cysteine S-methyltransferase n=1 Tax=Aaosphaeria arxii CBS 175.79 TaxID=1450172 RepID=A0A6A5Y4J0_9PLEO|nr:DNA binding methylated-DNA--cysteine S-methyltransferase [Aaosphaeria arxii CBS 175.79]KAF2019710.1 DNA binding methylated-DNA--cysteine S-methyltransferase [Aaosphaeria arxii CBS 175.79]
MAPGERSEEVWAWYTAVYEAVQEIPRGRVTSYGHIARLVGKPECPRQVGVVLKHLPSRSVDPSKKSATYHDGNVPWQRVINAKGSISPRGPTGASRQATALRAEGVEVERGPMGEYSIELSKYGWFPDELPSEAGLVESESEDDEGEEEDEEAAAYHT